MQHKASNIFLTWPSIVIPWNKDINIRCCLSMITVVGVYQLRSKLKGLDLFM